MSIPLLVYLLGFVFFSSFTMEGVREMHEERDMYGSGSDIINKLGERWGRVYIDLCGTIALVLWPLTIAIGVWLQIRRDA